MTVANSNVRIVLEGYRRLYVTDTAELTSDRRQARVFSTPSETTELNNFMAFMRTNYPDRVALEPAGGGFKLA